ncbi:MAG: ribonuclease HII [Candidatus Methanoperedens sp.]|nr:ribonuclease HII [Candidatus Methanoperedens sp.]
MIAGIDEAGKGPVLGPMCVAGLLLDEKKLDALARIGVRDSKLLSARRREVLAGQIKNISDKYYVLEVSPAQIDGLRKVMTMNEIMVACYVKVLEELRPDHAYVDAADVIAARFGENITKRYSGKINITSEHEADKKYPVVSAASILAKVQRDALVKQIGKTIGSDIGSGYPSDPKTIHFLEEWIREKGSLPDFARSSWETAKRLVEKNKKIQKTFSEY